MGPGADDPAVCFIYAISSVCVSTSLHVYVPMSPSLSFSVYLLLCATFSLHRFHSFIHACMHSSFVRSFVHACIYAFMRGTGPGADDPAACGDVQRRCGRPRVLARHLRRHVSAVLCRVMLCCAVLCWLCCPVLCRAALCCATPRHASLCCSALCGAVLCCTAMCCALPFCAALRCAMLCRALQCCAVRCGAGLCRAVQCAVVRCCAVCCGAGLCNNALLCVPAILRGTHAHSWLRFISFRTVLNVTGNAAHASGDRARACVTAVLCIGDVW